jgi:Flp pilus assembly protein TadG
LSAGRGIVGRCKRALGERRRDGERGAALVEMAICATLLIAITFGIIEFGNAWNRKLEVETAARSGARVGSSLASDRTADYGLLTATSSVLNDIGLSNVNYVVVYKSTTADGKRPGTCASSPPVAATGLCNVYTGAQLASLNASSFTASCTGNTGSALDHYWCPTGRQAVQSQNADYLGVYVQANYVTATGVFHSPFYLSSGVVMRLEPK